MRHVTVPGYSYRGPQDHSRNEEPIIAYIEGGWDALDHRLAELIRRELRVLERATGKSWDVT